MNRLAADYKRRGRDGTVKYQHLLADLGLPFPSTRFEPLRAGLTSGSAYHMFLRQLTGLNGEQQQLSALAFMRLVQQGAVTEWQQSARYDVLPQKKSSQSRTSLSQSQEDTQSQASRSRVTTPRRSTRVAGSPSRPRRAVSNIVTAGPASPARRSLSKTSKPARSRDTSSDPGSSSTDSDDIAVSDSRSRSRRSRAGRDDGNHDMRKLQHAINTLTPTLATRSVAPQPSISDRLRQQSGYDVMEDELMPSRPSRVTFAPARDDVSAATFRSMSQPVTSTTARTVPATDGVTEAMLGPVVYTRAGGNFKAWMEHAEFRQLRNKNEAQVWYEILDGMLAEGISVHSRAFEADARRLAAVFAADKYNNWDLARVISDGHAPGGDLLPHSVLDSFSTHLSRTAQLFRRAAGGNKNNAAQPHATAAHAPPYDDQLQQQQAPGQQRPYNNAYRGGNRSRPMTNPTTPTTSASTTAAGPASGASAAQ